MLADSTRDDLFVKKVADEVKRFENQRLDKEKIEIGSSKPEGHPRNPRQCYHPCRRSSANTIKIFIRGPRKASFHLPLELPLELHAHGFTWGATFRTNVDLHHFELDT